MKTIAAILLLGIFLFNCVGYRVLNCYLQGEAGRQLEAKLDHHQYDRSQLISIKVPVTHLAYYNNSGAFERTEGQIEINGIPYKYVERRIYNDSLELLCIPNHTALKLRSSRDEYFKVVSDLQGGQQPKPSAPSHSFKSLMGEPFTLTEVFHLDTPFITLTKRSSYYFESLSSISPAVDERPPACLA